MCKGEEVCAVTGPLRDKSRPIEEICAGCDLLPTKPSNIPMRVAQLVITAYRIEALSESNVAPKYPSFFTPLEWEAFLTLKYARAKDQEKDLQSRKREQQQGSAQAALEARMMRG